MKETFKIAFTESLEILHTEYIKRMNNFGRKLNVHSKRRTTFVVI